MKVRYNIRFLFLLVVGVFLFLFASGFGMSHSVCTAQAFELKVLDPRAELFSNPASPINPRLKSLDGKKIGILNNTKPGADYFQPYLLQVLKESYPTIEFKVWKISYNDYPKKADDLKAIAAWSDGVIGLLGD